MQVLTTAADRGAKVDDQDGLGETTLHDVTRVSKTDEGKIPYKKCAGSVTKDKVGNGTIKWLT